MKRKKSLLKKILLPLLMVMLVQAVLIYGAIILGGGVSQLKNNALDILDEKVSNRKNTLEHELVQRWANVDESVKYILEKTKDTLAKNNAQMTDIKFQNDLSQQLISSYTPDLLYLLRKNSVSGVFIILEGDQASKKEGLWLRDPNPQSNPNDYSDLLIERGSSLIAKELKIGMNSFWYPYFDFSEMEAQDTQFYKKPFNAVKAGEKYKNLGYWSPPFYLDRDSEDASMEMITYSVPLLNDDGSSFGVLGVEISMEYLKKQLPSKELNGGERDGYSLIVGSEEDQLEDAIISSMPRAYMSLENENKTVMQPDQRREGLYTFFDSENDKKEIAAIVKPLKLYNSHTPFENEQWSLVGAMEQNELFSFATYFEHLILITLIITTLIGLLGIFVVAKMLTRPISKVSKEVKLSESDVVISLGRANITEIDDLLDAIENLSKEVVESAFRLSKILEMAGVSIGAFEYKNNDRLFCTDGFFEVLNLSKEANENNQILIESFENFFKKSNVFSEPSLKDENFSVYRIEEEKTRWIRMKTVRNGEEILGVITDITEDMLTRKKIEFERDYDVLTNLYNRRAFQSRSEVIFKQPQEMKIAALVMIDLDNLKYVNDTYGHDYGDAYIRCAGSILKNYESDHSLISRLSGDEFVLFFYGYESEKLIEIICDFVQKDLGEMMIALPDHTEMPIRASGGIAWYPKDALNYEDLIHYADFAMYMVKKTTKGKFTNFNLETYQEESYLLHCKEELNTLLEQGLIDYQFQPIVDAKTGEIFAFEALMRPQSENIKTPDALLSLARTQSKLSQIEKLTFFKGMEKFVHQPMVQSHCKIFLNSISNQILSMEELIEFENKYEPFLKRLVIELTEEERSEEGMTKMKQDYIKKWQAEIALDDFGSGYNNETVLLNLKPHYVKVDMEIVQNIHCNKDHLQILKNLVTYSKERNIKVIAEGVETKELMEALIKEGVDYLQGYYLGKPSYAPKLEIKNIKAKILELNKKEQA